MDSVTQFVFGAGLGVALLGRRIGPRKAAIVGGCMGTVPDLDVFYPFDTAVDSFTLHRGPTHSLVMQAVATPFFAEGLRALFQRVWGDGTSRTRWSAAIYIIFATHALLDAVTVYGTRLLWPIWDEPFGIGALFIIDPIFTIPLIVLVIWALCLGHWGPTIRKVTKSALAVSFVYLGWSLAAQQIAVQRAVAFVPDAPETVLATATPFNTLFWRVTMLDGDRYLNVYVPLLGGEDEIRVYEHPRLTEALGCVFDRDEAQRLFDFADGYVRVDRDGERLIVSDLRMGLTPDYVFRFAFAPDGEPATRVEAVRDIEKDLAWLEAGILGSGIPRSSEADVVVAIPGTGC